MNSRRVTPAVLNALWFHRALGIVPILLSEISPPAFRSSFAGVAYQTGSMVSSASAQIEAGEYPRALRPLTPFDMCSVALPQLPVNTLARRL